MTTLVTPSTDTPVQTIVLMHCDARIDNRQQLIYALKLSKFAPNEEIILAAYQRWQMDCARHIQGDFAFVIFDKRHQAYLLARDPMGCRPLFYYHNHAQFFFADNIPALLNQLAQVPATNKQWVANFLSYSILMTSQYSDETYHQHVYRVTPGHCLVIAGNTKKSLAYWDIDTETELRYNDDREYIDGFKEQLHRAVYRRVQLADRIGTELSGGLDSSSVAVIAKQYQPDIEGFSNVPNPNDPNKALTNEKPYAEAVAEFAGIKKMHWIDGTDEALSIEQLLIDAVKFCGMPCDGVYPIYAAPLYQTAQQAGVHDLLSGFGGDQGVNIQGAQRASQLVLSHQWMHLWQVYRESKISAYKSSKRVLLSMISEYLPWLRALKPGKKDEIVDLVDFALSNELLAEVDLPKQFPLLALKRRAMRMNLRQMQRHFFVEPDCWHVRTRIESSAIIAKRYGIQYSYPLLDTELLQYAISLPAHIKFQQGVHRYLFRQTMEGLLPTVLLNRFDKTGGTVPGVFYRYEQYMASATTPTCSYASLSAGLNKWDGMRRRQWEFLKMMQIMTQS